MYFFCAKCQAKNDFLKNVENTVNAGLVANSVYSDETPRSAAFDQGLHCLYRPGFPYLG